MEKFQYRVTINQAAEKVYDLMLGLSNKSTYEEWTAMFNPTSTYEGSWDKGSKILFVGVDEKGNKGGIVSAIAENIRNQFVSIRHNGLVKDGREIMEGPDVEKWTGGYENYTFEENNAVTTLVVDLEVTGEMVDYMNRTYPKALNKLKEICEN